jgi:hypothetical protein
VSQQVKRAQVRIWDRRGQTVGTGFLVAPRHVLTCAHVVARALDSQEDVAEPPTDVVLLDFPLLDPSPPTLSASVVHWLPVQPDDRGDIAGLFIEDEVPAGVQPLPLVALEEPWGHRFRAFGFPRASQNGDWASGELREVQGAGWLQVVGDAPAGRRVQAGYSGAPAWVEGRVSGVVGMVVAADRGQDDRVAYLIPTPVLVDAWPQVLGSRALPTCPYRGLDAFHEEDAAVFFGRDDVVERLLEATSRQPLVAVLGPSGSGKSSVVAAGLAATLRHEGDVAIGQFRPGSAPLNSLAAALLPLVDPLLSPLDRLRKTPELVEILRGGRLDEVVDTILAGSSWRRLLLVVDQLEELFTLCSDVVEQETFLDLLAQVSTQRAVASQTPLTVVVAMRADFLNEALEHRGFADALRGAMEPLGPMTRAQLRTAIERPAAARGVAFAEGLVERILDDAGQSAGRLPLLEFVLTLLWEHQEAQRLSHHAYERLGKVQGALARYAEDVYTSLAPADQDRARRLFGQLVRLGQAAEDTRRTAARAEFAEEEWALVLHLADKRLLVTDHNPAAEETVQVAHEALIREWGRLRGWLATDRPFLIWLERMRDAVSLWKANNRDEGALLRGSLLDEAERWCAERPSQVTLEIRAFVDQSRAERAQELFIRAKVADDLDQKTTQYRKALTIARELGDKTLQLRILDSLIALSPSLARAIDHWPAHRALDPPPSSSWISRIRHANHLAQQLQERAKLCYVGLLSAWALALLLLVLAFSPLAFSPIVIGTALAATALVLRTYHIGARALIALPLVFWIFLSLVITFTQVPLLLSVVIAVSLGLLLLVINHWGRPKVLQPVQPFVRALLHPIAYRRNPSFLPIDDPTSIPDGDA